MRDVRGLVGIALVALVVLQACGGGGSGDAAGPSARPGASGAEQPPLLSADRIEVLGSDFRVAGEGRAVDVGLPPVCGRAANRDPVADSRRSRSLRNGAHTISVTTSLFVFRDELHAVTAMQATRHVLHSCPAGTPFHTPAGSFVVVVPPTIQNGGDDSFSRFARDPTTGLVVADHFVRRGRYVLTLRFSVSGDAGIDAEILASVAVEASREFASWADDH